MAIRKLSIVIPVYFNEKNLLPLYADLSEKVLQKLDCAYELVLVDDGSKDDSYAVMQQLKSLMAILSWFVFPATLVLTPPYWPACRFAPETAPP